MASGWRAGSELTALKLMSFTRPTWPSPASIGAPKPTGSTPPCSSACFSAGCGASRTIVPWLPFRPWRKRMVFDHQGEHASQAAAISSIAAKIGCAPETLRGWVRQAERDQGRRAGPTTAEQERIRALEREVRELRQANEILRKASAYFAMAELDRRSKP